MKDERQYLVLAVYLYFAIFVLVPPMTLAEMASAKIEPKYRDFCVHKLTALKKCNKDNFPWTMPCANARHALFECQYEE